MIDHAHVDVAIARGRRCADEAVLDLDDAHDASCLERRELVAERSQLVHRRTNDRGAKDVAQVASRRRHSPSRSSRAPGYAFPSCGPRVSRDVPSAAARPRKIFDDLQFEAIRRARAST